MVGSCNHTVILHRPFLKTLGPAPLSRKQPGEQVAMPVERECQHVSEGSGRTMESAVAFKLASIGGALR